MGRNGYQATGAIVCPVVEGKADVADGGHELPPFDIVVSLLQRMDYSRSINA